MGGSQRAEREPSDEESALMQFEALRREFQVVLDGYQGIRTRVEQLAKTEKRLDELERMLLEDVMTKGFGKVWKDLGGRLNELTTRFNIHQAHEGQR